jgi:hypothetical protein
MAVSVVTGRSDSKRYSGGWRSQQQHSALSQNHVSAQQVMLIVGVHQN